MNLEEFAAAREEMKSNVSPTFDHRAHPSWAPSLYISDFKCKKCESKFHI